MMSAELPPTRQWLSLREAADQLAVHPTTLRRWADDGAIPVLRTPGGHRRFALDDVERFARSRQQRRRNDVEQTWARQALATTRQELRSSANSGWLQTLDDTMRQEHRQLGQRLMGLVMQYIAVHDEEVEAQMLDEAREIGRIYARNAFIMHMPLSEALRAFLFFRDTLVETTIQIPESARQRTEANQRLLRRINTILNTVQITLVENLADGALPLE